MYTHGNTDGPEHLTEDAERRLNMLMEGVASPEAEVESNVIPLGQAAPEGVVCKNGVCSLGSWKPTRKVA